MHHCMSHCRCAPRFQCHNTAICHRLAKTNPDGKMLKDESGNGELANGDRIGCPSPTKFFKRQSSRPVSVTKHECKLSIHHRRTPSLMTAPTGPATRCKTLPLLVINCEHIHLPAFSLIIVFSQLLSETVGFNGHRLHPSHSSHQLPPTATINQQAACPSMSLYLLIRLCG